ncbi:CGNR zinc finger domain-containing protein [Saccharopolyspora halophila]|uniref:CGNR zinc finger domain-containing protein n=1 Tax=Saccharopolyspora halophila TaxID=405551 RepID=A0ABP5TBG8_9PSEU
MEFDSHTNGVVSAAVALVNALTPGQARGRDYAPAPEELADRAHEALLTGSRTGARRPTDEEARALAEVATRLRAVFTHLDAGDMNAACEHVNELLRTTEAAPVLSNHDGGVWHVHFHALDADYARSWEAPMATALAIVLGNPSADRLGVCSAPACDRVYLDTSRNGTRRFCSTACQNRVKAAHFRSRRTGG